MKTCLKLALSLMSAAALLAIVPSCEPENVPETDPTEKPDPTPEPNPEPDPDPDPTPDSAPEQEGTVIYYDNLDKEKSTANNNYFDTWTACRNPGPPAGIWRAREQPMSLMTASTPRSAATGFPPAIRGPRA